MIRRSKNPGEGAKLDQEIAAVKETGRLFRRMSHIVTKPTVRYGVRDAGWVNVIVADRLAMQLSGDPELTTCGHLASPRPTFLPSWAKHMSCQACVTSLPKPADEEDLTCDRCRVYPKQTYIAVIQVGQYTVLGGLCAECRSAQIEVNK